MVWQYWFLTKFNFTSKCYSTDERLSLGFSALDDTALLKQDSMKITEKKLHFSSLYFPPKQDCGNLPELLFQCRKEPKTIRKRRFKKPNQNRKPKNKNPQHLQITALSRLDRREEKTQHHTEVTQLANSWPASTQCIRLFLLPLGKVQPLLPSVLQNKDNCFVARKWQRAKKPWPKHLCHNARCDAFNRSGPQAGNLPSPETEDKSMGEVINTRSCQN